MFFSFHAEDVDAYEADCVYMLGLFLFFFSFLSLFLDVKAFGFCEGGILMVVGTASSSEILLNLAQKCI